MTCALTGPSTEAEAQRAQMDLRAQQEMANWALAMFFATAIGVATTVIGLIYVVRAYRLNAAATDYASAAATAATATNDLMREQFSAERRPWLSLTCTVSPMFEQNQTAAGIKGLYLNVLCAAKNHGQSPATHISFHAEIALLNAENSSMELAMNKYCDGIRARAGQTGEALFPGDEGNYSHMVFLPLSAIENDIASKDFKAIAPIIYGCINYKSNFTTGVCQTRFAYMVATQSDGVVKVLMPDDAGEWLKQPIGLAVPNLIEAN